MALRSSDLGTPGNHFVAALPRREGSRWVSLPRLFPRFLSGRKSPPSESPLAAGTTASNLFPLASRPRPTPSSARAHPHRDSLAKIIATSAPPSPVVSHTANGTQTPYIFGAYTVPIDCHCRAM